MFWLSPRVLLLLFVWRFRQVAYQLTVTLDKQPLWDSGKVASNESTYVAYTGPNLTQGTPYEWSVVTFTAPASGGAPCQSSPSDSATFITALFDGFVKQAHLYYAYIGACLSCSRISHAPILSWVFLSHCLCFVACDRHFEQHIGPQRFTVVSCPSFESTRWARGYSCTELATAKFCLSEM